MRLLAHGGTSYSERRRIGAWATIPREALEDTYGLPGESMIYGVGVLGDCLPFLVVRLRQMTDAGRSYAYSLLLDPGREVWLRFGWNAADLLRALLDDEIGDALLSQPESISAADLTRRLDLLRPANDSAAPCGSQDSSQRSTQLIDCWIGATFADEPIALAPAAFGFDARPRHEEFARLLYLVPQPCFRTGVGWLVGGSREHAQALGARLVLDDGVNGGEPPLSSLAADGRLIAEAWSHISEDSEFRTAVSDLENVPPCEWIGAAGGAAARERLLLLGETINPGHPTDQLFQTLESQLEHSPFLAGAVRRAAHRLALAGADGTILSGARTALVLRNFYDYGLAVSEADVERLDPETLVEMIVARESQATRQQQPLPLPRARRAEIYVRRLERANYDQLPDLTLEAIAFVEGSFEPETRNRNFDPIFAVLERRTQTTGDSLHVWDDFPRELPLWSRLANVLREAAFARARQSGRRGWETEYLRYGKDHGGSILACDPVNVSDASRLVRVCLDEVARRGDLAALATQWLDALAVSRFRDAVPVADKIAVAEAGVSNRWLPLLALWAGYINAANAADFDPALPTGLGGEREREALVRELGQMWEEHPPGESIPNLSQIKRVLGKVPGDFVLKLYRRHTRLRDARALAGWVKGLCDINDHETAAEETVRFALESGARLPEDWLFHGFDESRLVKLADKLLFRGFASDDESYRDRCKEVLSTQHRLPRLRKIFARVFKDGYVERDSLANFIRRYAGQEPALGRIFACFAETTRRNVVRHLVEHDEGAFLKEARAIIDSAASGSPPTPYSRAVLLYLSRDDRLKKKLVRWELQTASGLDAQLKELLASPGDSRDDDGDAGIDDTGTGDETTLGAPARVRRVSVDGSDDEEPRGAAREGRERSGARGIVGTAKSWLRGLIQEELPPELYRDGDDAEPFGGEDLDDDNAARPAPKDEP